jgi:hypothetical protein
LLKPISVAIVYNIILKWDTKTYKTMLEPIVVMYECQTWDMTDRITVSEFLGEEHFEEGIRATKWVRDLENQNQRRTEGTILNIWLGSEYQKTTDVIWVCNYNVTLQGG